jgi:hypothetical protein
MIVALRLATFSLSTLLGLEAAAQVFARSDDTRVAPPEQRARPRRATLDLALGGALLDGNVDHLALNASLTLGLRLSRSSELFLDGAAAHAFFDGDAKIDKDKGSLLYVLALASHWNLYLQSTHSRNRFLTLDYRTANSLGACLHGFGGELLRPILLSAGVTPEVEWWRDGTREVAVRATLRLNAVLPVGRLAYGADVIVAPLLWDARDLRLYVQTYVELRLAGELLALRLNLEEEYDSRPPPGVRRYDLTLAPQLVIRTRR